MHIRNLTAHARGNLTHTAATVAWEDSDYPEQALFFTVIVNGDDSPATVCEPSADAFLTALFPLAAMHGEARVRIEGRACPMLVEGLRTAYAWWASWGGMPTPAPEIEAIAYGGGAAAGPRRAVACLSGGVDGLHMLMRNRRLYGEKDPAYIRDALFIHGFDIGKRARDPEEERYQMALHRLEPIAEEMNLRLVTCRTNIRHFPSRPDFWTYRQNGAALASVGHVAAPGPAYLFIGATFDAANPVPMGSHPAVDGLFSSQRVAVIHDGSRFTRLEKVRELVRWPTGLAALRVCSANVGNRVNCGCCEKCLRTRLELLAAGVEETAAFGPSLTPVESWAGVAAEVTRDHAIIYADLLPALRAQGRSLLVRTLEEMIRSSGEPKTPAFARDRVNRPRLFA